MKPVNKTVCSLAALAPLAMAQSANAGQRPNIIFFLVDDFGWTETSLPFGEETYPNNLRFHTPNMERLARTGVMMTNAYACPVSTPTRTSMMTGMNAAHMGITSYCSLYKDTCPDAIGGRPGTTNANEDDIFAHPEWNYNGIQPDTVKSPHNTANATPITSLPQVLHDNGYYTIHCGKAHFGARTTPGADPSTMGFDVNIGGGPNGAPGSYLGTENFGAGSKFAVEGLEKYHGTDIFLTEALTIEAIEAMKTSIAAGQPFFLYMSHYAVHSPYSEDKRFVGNYLGKQDEQLNDTLKSSEARYAALVEGMDKSLGDLLDFLQSQPEVAQNTIILFMSDNGGQALNNVRQGTANRDQNYPARAGKGSAFMGGVREPMMVYWPGVTQGGTTTTQRVIIEDFYPTILDMAGIKTYETHQTIDGISFVQTLRGDTSDVQRPLVWHFPNLWGETQNTEEGYGAYSAILKGNYHLIYTWETGRLRLYDTANDIGEQNDIAANNPEVVKALATELSQYLRERDAQRPSFKSTGKLCPWPDETL